jgi:glutathione-specific gamma-glutamylcyclotransferase
MCRGIAYRLVEDDVETAWERLWEREMGSGVYRASWVSVETDTYGRVPALTFIVNRDHPHYAGPMPSNHMAAIMAGAKGSYGPCRDYLAGTIDEMRKLNVIDRELEALLAEVDALESSGSNS